jgi:hypothetical protein
LRSKEGLPAERRGVYSPALFRASTSTLKFAGAANPKVQKLAWWTDTDSGDLQKSAQEFWAKLHKSTIWKGEFKKGYGIDYSRYLELVGNL